MQMSNFAYADALARDTASIAGRAGQGMSEPDGAQMRALLARKRSSLQVLVSSLVSSLSSLQVLISSLLLDRLLAPVLQVP